MKRFALSLLLLLLPTVSGCTPQNNPTNVSTSPHIWDLQSFLYAEEVIRLQQENASLEAEGKSIKLIPRYSEWFQGMYGDRVAYSEYFNTSHLRPDLNPAPMVFEEWIKLPSDERPEAKNGYEIDRLGK